MRRSGVRVSQGPLVFIMTRHKRYALFIGRWQPFHLGHKHIIDKALAQGKNVAIAVRDTELSEKNPYTVEQRIEMIRRVYGNKVLVFPICDIESINVGREVGYQVRRINVPQEIQQISASNIRNNHRAYEAPDVPLAVRKYIASLSPTLWFMGRPCSGKTTLARALKLHLADKNRRVIHLDGDVLRAGLNQDLGFSPQDREENLRRAAHLAKLFNEQGHTVVCSFITPTRKTRAMLREIIANLKIIYLKCSLETCLKRDTKGLYQKAQRGEIVDFTGVDAPFEEPQQPDMVVETDKWSIERCVQQVVKSLE